LLGLKGQTPSSLILSAVLYCGEEEYDHGNTSFPLRTRPADLLFFRRHAMTTSTALH